jgi:hypothetical protein
MPDRESAGDDREHRLITKLYGPDLAEQKVKLAEEPKEMFVDIEDLAFFGIPGEGRKWPHQ